MSDMSSVVNASVEIVVVFALAFCMKSIGLFNQEHAQKLLDVVINFLVPLNLMKNLPTVQLNLTWLVLPIGAILFASITMPIYRLIFLRAFPTLPRADRGQLLLCCTGHAVTLVGYPVVAGFYGESRMALCACFDLGGFIVAYLATFVVAALYAPTCNPTGQDAATEVQQASQEAEVVESGMGTKDKNPDPVSGRCRSVTMAGLGSFMARLEQESRRSSAATAPAVMDIVLPQSFEVELTTLSDGHVMKSMDDLTSSCPSLEPISRRASAAASPASPIGLDSLLAEILWKVAKKPTTIGFLMGVLMRTLNVQIDALPEVVKAVMAKSAGCTATMTIFGLGLFFQPALLMQKKYLRRLAVLFLVRYGFGLAVGVLMYLAMRSVDVLVPSVLSIALVMPTPPVVIAYAAEYGYDRDFAALVVNASLLVSFLLAFGLALFLPLLAPEAATSSMMSSGVVSSAMTSMIM